MNTQENNNKCFKHMFPKEMGDSRRNKMLKKQFAKGLRTSIAYHDNDNGSRRRLSRPRDQ